MVEMDYGQFSPFDVREGQWLNSLPDLNDLASGESTIGRMFIVSSGVVISNGNCRFTYFTATKTETISQIQVTSGTVAAGATPTKVRFGIYSVAANGDLTLIASTPNDTTLLGASLTLYSKPLSVPFTKIKGQRYAFCLFVETAAATPTTMGFIIANAAIGFMEPKLASLLGSQSDLPASVANGSLGSSSQLTYARLVP